MTWVQVFTQSIICNLTLTFFPTPGASGGAEGSFLLIFGSVFGDNPFWPVLFWRFSTYYIILLLGLIVLVYDFAVGNKKLERLKSGSKIDTQAKETSFREALEKDRENINLVREQEGDKILYEAFLKNKATKKTKKEIIQNSQIVSEQEMDEIIYPAEKILDEMTEKRNQRKIKRTEKKVKRRDERRKKRKKE